MEGVQVFLARVSLRLPYFPIKQPPSQCNKKMSKSNISRRDEVVGYVLVMEFNLLLTHPQAFLA
jgi:hypothetical protein